MKKKILHFKNTLARKFEKYFVNNNMKKYICKIYYKIKS